MNVERLTSKISRKWKEYLCFWWACSLCWRRAWVPRHRMLLSTCFQAGLGSVIPRQKPWILPLHWATLFPWRVMWFSRNIVTPPTVTDSGEDVYSSSLQAWAICTTRCAASRSLWYLAAQYPNPKWRWRLRSRSWLPPSRPWAVARWPPMTGLTSLWKAFAGPPMRILRQTMTSTKRPKVVWAPSLFRWLALTLAPPTMSVHTLLLRMARSMATKRASPPAMAFRPWPRQKL